jgi:hypothetical protein
MKSFVAWSPERILMLQLLQLIPEATVTQAFLRRMLGSSCLLIWMSSGNRSTLTINERWCFHLTETTEEVGINFSVLRDIAGIGSAPLFIVMTLPQFGFILIPTGLNWWRSARFSAARFEVILVFDHMTKTKFSNVLVMILDWQEHEVLSIISERTNICEGQVG